MLLLIRFFVTVGKIETTKKGKSRLGPTDVVQLQTVCCFPRKYKGLISQPITSQHHRITKQLHSTV